MIINNDTIVKDDDLKIREKSFDVELPLSLADQTLLQEMLTYVKESCDPKIAEEKNLRPAVGISAVQVGVLKKMCAIVVNDYDKNNQEIHYEYALVNPKIVSYSVQKAYLGTGEGCLSVPDVHDGFVYRSARIKVKAFDMLQNKDITIRAHGFLAIVIQHELDHFNGVLFYDHIDPKKPFHQEKDAIEI